MKNQTADMTENPQVQQEGSGAYWVRETVVQIRQAGKQGYLSMNQFTHYCPLGLDKSVFQGAVISCRLFCIVPVLFPLDAHSRL